MSIGSEYNDNYNMSQASPNSVWGYNVSPQVKLSASAQEWSLNGRAQINRVDYPNRRQDSHTDDLVELNYSRQNELNKWGLDANLTSDSTLASELSETGIVVDRAQRSSRTLAPSWASNLTEHDAVTLEYSYNDVTYSSAAGTSLLGLLDYKVHAPNISLSHVLSENTSLNLSLGYTDYKSLNTPDLYTSQYHQISKSARIGISHTFSETLHGSVTAGLNKTDTTVDALEARVVLGLPFFFPTTTNSSGSGSLVNASLEQTYEASKLSGSISRSLNPSGNGGLRQTDRLSVNYSADFTPRLNGVLSLDMYNSQSSSVSNNSITDRYYSLSPTLTWKMTEWWTVRTTYNRAVSQPATGADAKGNAMHLTLDYIWPKISSSR